MKTNKNRRATQSLSEKVGQASSLPVHGASSPRVSGGRMPPELADKMSAPHFQKGSQAIAKSLVARLTGKYALRLFIAGATDRSRQAILNVRRLCETELKDNCTLEVIDIYQQPRLARDNQIVATPTLIREFPLPVRRFIGNLANLTGLFVGGDLPAKN